MKDFCCKVHNKQLKKLKSECYSYHATNSVLQREDAINYGGLPPGSVIWTEQSLGLGSLFFQKTLRVPSKLDEIHRDFALSQFLVLLASSWLDRTINSAGN